MKKLVMMMVLCTVPCWAHNLAARYANAPGAPVVIVSMLNHSCPNCVFDR